MNQALGNLIATGRSVYDYYSLYKTQPGLNLELNEKKENFERALNHFENTLANYRQDLLNYKNVIDFSPKPTLIPMDDDISIDPNAL